MERDHPLDTAASTGSTIERATIIDRRYRVLRRLGQGGMGEVYQAVHILTGRQVALKLIPSEAIADPTLRKRFQVECAAPEAIAVRSDAPAYVRHSDAGIDLELGAGYIAMDLLEGEDLQSALEWRGRLPEAEVIEIIKQVAAGLDAAHAAGYVHRDIKPANLFATPRADGGITIRIIDWGIARLVSAGVQATSPFGTPPYAPPEQILGDGTIDPRADVYALGMTAFTLLVGKLYFDLEIQEGRAPAIFRGPDEPGTVRARRYGKELPSTFDGWFRRATAPSRADRFLSAAELATELEQVLGEMPAPLPAVASVGERVAAAPRRIPTGWLLVTGLLLAATAVISWTLRGTREAPGAVEVSAEVPSPPTTAKTAPMALPQARPAAPEPVPMAFDSMAPAAALPPLRRQKTRESTRRSAPAEVSAHPAPDGLNFDHWKANPR